MRGTELFKLFASTVNVLKSKLGHLRMSRFLHSFFVVVALLLVFENLWNICFLCCYNHDEQFPPCTIVTNFIFFLLGIFYVILVVRPFGQAIETVEFQYDDALKYLKAVVRYEP